MSTGDSIVPGKEREGETENTAALGASHEEGHVNVRATVASSCALSSSSCLFPPLAQVHVVSGRKRCWIGGDHANCTSHQDPLKATSLANLSEKRFW